MERWVGKVAVVTGASAGIGAAIVIDLVKNGMITIGLARRVERVEELKSQIPEKLRQNLYAVQCDVTSEEDIVKCFTWIEKAFGGVDVLINNAGIIRPALLTENNNSTLLREVIDTNIFGLVFCTREAFMSMAKRSVAGHIIHINSVGGHIVPYIPNLPPLNLYSPSKHAVTALTEVYRQEFNFKKSKTKVTSISPGYVRTEILSPEVTEQLTEWSYLEPEDIAKSVLYILGTPPHVQIHELTIRPVGELF